MPVGKLEARRMARTARKVLECLFDSVPAEVKDEYDRDYQACRRFLREMEYKSAGLLGYEEEDD